MIQNTTAKQHLQKPSCPVGNLTTEAHVSLPKLEKSIATCNAE